LVGVLATLLREEEFIWNGLCVFAFSLMMVGLSDFWNYELIEQVDVLNLSSHNDSWARMMLHKEAIRCCHSYLSILYGISQEIFLAVLN